MKELPSRRRIILKHILVNCVLVALLICLGAWCYDQGKTYKVLLGNYAFTGQDGQDYPALEAVEVFIDGNDPVFLLEDDSGTGDATGRKHTMVIALLDENDEPIESRTVQFSIAELGKKLELNVAEYWLKAK
ncbi:DUF6672 family protein [Mailhella massiliensis]|uniref:DUF6672 family protein n=1 Tax=Mailhella massiliensis TaxID=1903261 RepID=UPI002354EB09|nr:DUF6672 family protein [Mailhella massiliensis]